VEVDRAYLLSAYLDDNFPEGYYACVEVSDTGVGMSEQTKAKLFDPFFSTKFTGRGLGLAAVLGIVRGHKGAVKVYSELGEGTTFSILLPTSEKLAETGLEISNAMQDWRGSGTVLVADDEQGVRAIAKRMLEQFGFSVLTANDGSEAVQAFVDHSKDIVLTLLDMTMPHMDGEAAFQEIRRSSPEARVILMSGYNEPHATSRFQGKGLAGFVQKPFQLQQLIGKVREVLEG
jgi:CheY-like chemotaxis protein